MLKGKAKNTAVKVTKEKKTKVDKKPAKAAVSSRVEKKATEAKVEKGKKKKKDSPMEIAPTELTLGKVSPKTPASKVKKEKNRKPASKTNNNKKLKVKEAPANEDVLPDPADRRPEDNRPSLRTVYSNRSYTLLPLGFATDFSTKMQMIIFSDLATGEVHTTGLSVWKRWKLKEVKKINTET